ncbi:MAG: hydrolase [Clostridiaceae bacterium]|jgi:nicotinamidase-related amidase|nr:hydrolase [Clostridiaceae bacterium]
MTFLAPENSLILVIDIQEKLVKAVDGQKVSDNASKLLKAANVLSIPAIITEQYPKGLGETMPELKDVANADFFEKTSFSALKTPEIFDKIKKSGRKKIILCGIETHICVYQTAIELIENGYEVYLLKDVCASRDAKNSECAFDLLQSYGIKISCLEIVLFEWLKSSKHPKFKDVQSLIK